MGRAALKVPACISSEDAIERFLDATCAYDTGDCANAVEPMAVLYWVYRRWCSRRSIKPMGVSGFGRALSEHGFVAAKIGDGRARRRGWMGLRLDSELREAAEESLLLKAERTARSRKSGPTKASRPGDAMRQAAPVGIVWKFLVWCTSRETDSVELFADLYASFRYWCGVCDYYPLGRKKFGEVLKQRFDLEDARIGHKRIRAKRGVRLDASWRRPSSRG